MYLFNKVSLFTLLDEEAFAIAVLEQLADGCRQMGLPQAWCALNTMVIKALKAGVDSPMEDYICHLPVWNGKHDYVGELVLMGYKKARRAKGSAFVILEMPSD